MKRKIYAAFMLAVMCLQITAPVFASSHREAPLIADDPLADNTDVYAFRSPDNPNKITIIANYVPGQLPQGGPNYYSFGKTSGTRSTSTITLPQRAMILCTVSRSKKRMKIQPLSSTSVWVCKT